MRRRSVLRLFGLFLGGATAMTAASPAAHAQSVPLVGFLNSASPQAWSAFVASFRDGLKETGFVDGRNVAIEYRWAEGRYERLPAMAAELVKRNVAVLVTTGGIPPLAAAKAATSSVPIVFTLGSDPVKLGYVASLNRPGGNITGIYLFTSSIDEKRFGLLSDTVSSPAPLAALVNPTNPNTAGRLKGLLEAARSLGRTVRVFNATTMPEIEAAFAEVKSFGARGLFVAADPFFNGQRAAIVALTLRHTIPAIFEGREFAAMGGLMSYGTNFRDNYRQAGVYTGRVLKGEKPADLPVMQSTKFEFVINLRTAKQLGLQVPPGVSAQADEVIE